MSAASRWRRLSLPGAGVALDELAFVGEAATWFDGLRDGVSWQTHRLRLFGRELEAPRRCAWHGDPEATYRYSGLRLEPQGWTPLLAEIRAAVSRACRTRFNCVLLNLYRSGKDSMGWHSDNEPELGPRPLIASLSLGCTRRMRFRPRHSAWPSGQCPPGLGVDLPAGSLLLMAGNTQRLWAHCLVKTRRPVGMRINLTFRRIGSATRRDDLSDGQAL